MFGSAKEGRAFNRGEGKRRGWRGCILNKYTVGFFIKKNTVGSKEGRGGERC